MAAQDAHYTITFADENGDALELQDIVAPVVTADPAPIVPADVVVRALSAIDPATLVTVDDIPQSILSALGYSGATVFNAGDIKVIASLALTLFGSLIVNGVLPAPTPPTSE